VGINSNTNENQIKALSNWPNSCYYNIWLVSEIDDNNGGSGTQGYAYFPVASDAVDGTVCLYNAFGTVGNLKSYTNLNRTLTHETGHYLNLYHTFAGGSCTETNCATQGDLVCDTPPTLQGGSCSAPICAGQLVQNYMDYTSGTCQNMFTQGQVDRMRAALQGPRSSLLSCNGCTPVTPPVCDFKSDTYACVGDVVQFTDMSTNAPTSWSWTFPGGTPASSTVQNPTVTYSTAGTYNVSITATNGLGTCTGVTKTNYITVYGTPIAGCSPPTNTSNAGGIGIYNVTFNTINNSTGSAQDDPGYLDLTCSQTTQVQAGNCYPISVATGATNDEDVKVYIDYNNNGTFELPDELAFSSEDKTQNHSGTICIPCDADTATLLRMRVVDDFYPNAITPCGSLQYGQTEDYGIYIIPCTNPPKTKMSVTDSTICTNVSINFTDISAQDPTSGIPTSWSWSFPGATPVSSTLQNPTGIVYSAAGTYTVTLTTTNAFGSDTQTKTNYITVQNGPTIGTASTDVTCNGGTDGTATATPVGGTLPYTYKWNDPGAKTLATVTNLAAGTYIVTVSDGGGCNTPATVTVNEPAPINPGISVFNDVTCKGSCDGSATVTANGGTGAKTYKWSDGQTTQTGTGFCSSNYIVTVTDANGCKATTTVSFTEPAGLFAGISNSTVVSGCGICDGTAKVTGSGGTAPYTYKWSNNQTTQTGITLCASSYIGTVIDANGCKATAQINITNPSGVNASISSKTNVLCNGDCTGDATLSGAGGTAPYSYKWSDGQATQSANALCVGTIVGTIIDANGCKSSASATITQPTALTASTASKTNPTCNAKCNGSVVLVGNGGSPSFSYSWTNGDKTPLISNLCTGTYTGTVTDVNGCKATASTTITEPTAVVASITASNNTTGGCGVCDGDATMGGVGGTPPYTYFWSDGQATQSATSLCAGSYNAQVTDANFCFDVTSVNILDPIGVNLSISQTNLVCFEECIGDATMNPTLGSPPYSYKWSDGQTTQTISNLCAGTYTGTLTDSKGCMAYSSVIILEPSEIIPTITTANNATACGGCDGQLNISGSGGTGALTYSWSNGSTATSISGLCAGAYMGTVIDANNCKKIGIRSIAESTLSAIIADRNISCSGACDGGVEIVVSGGDNPYTFSWSNGVKSDTSFVQINLCPGTFTGTVTDGNGCIAVAAAILSEEKIIPLSITAYSNPVNCGGGNDGSATSTAKGGLAPYTYNWSSSQSTQTINGLVAGTYTVTVTDSAGCQAWDQVVVLTDPSQVTASIVGTNASCNSVCNGTADLTPSNGTTPYTYLWSNSATTQNIATLCQGTFTVTVTDANGCKAGTEITITEPSILSISATATIISCNGGCNGTIDATPSGGNSPYTYLWSNGNNTEDLSNLCVGTYTVTVYDTKGCKAYTNVTVIEPSALTASVNGTNITCNALCNGQAGASGAGGTAPYSAFNWSDGSSTQNINNLCAGTYRVTVSDFFGCTASAQVTIIEPTIVTATILDSNDPNCVGSCDGDATLTGSGGTGPYTFKWSNSQSSQTATSLCAGTYTGTVVDANGCKGFASVVLTDPPAITASITASTNPSCNGICDGDATLAGLGGTGNLTYSWSNSQTTQQATSLCPSTVYTGTVTDANGCQATANTSLSDPSAIVPALTADSVSCFGLSDGSAKVTAIGGTPGYTYRWNSGGIGPFLNNQVAGTYTATVTDSKGCKATGSITIKEPLAIIIVAASTPITCPAGNDGTISIVASNGNPPYTYAWSTGDNTTSISNLPAGTYDVTVTDSKGCQSTDAVVQEKILDYEIYTDSTDVSCFGGSDGSVRITAKLGNSPYTYSWNTGASTQELTGLIAGTYYVTTNDVNGCEKYASITVNEPTALVLSLGKTDLSCNGSNDGTVGATTSGGTNIGITSTSGYTYIWNTGSTDQGLDSLGAGTYTVTVTDANGCQLSSSITITEPAPVVLTNASDSVNCKGGSDGMVSVTATGGVPAYKYKWNTSDTTQTVNNLSAGVYMVSVTDAAGGCYTVDTITVYEPDTFIMTSTFSNLSCNGSNDGTASITANGGVQPYNFTWSSGTITSTATYSETSNLAATTIYGTVTDANGCMLSNSFSLTQPPKLNTSFTSTNLTCNNSCDGVIDVTVGGGSAPYYYSWSNSSTSQDLTSICAGTYNVTVSDNNACDTVMTIIITQPDTISATVTESTPASCNNSDGEATVSLVAGGTAPYQYSSDGLTFQSNTVISNLSAGSNTITIRDTNNCINTFLVTITEPSDIIATITNDSLSCNGSADGVIYARSVIGGVNPYQFSLDTSAGYQADSTFNGLIAGNYTVTIQGSNGCLYFFNDTVGEPALLIATMIDSLDIDCFGNSTGLAEVSGAGGNGSYTYGWSDGANQSTAIATSLGAGNYSVTVTDSKNCNAIATVSLSQPTQLSVSISGSNLTCNNSCDGLSTITVSGGSGGYTFLWSTGVATQNISSLCAGDYTVTVTDNNGCDTSLNITITQPDTISATITETQQASCNNSDGEATVSAVAGGTAPYQYSTDGITFQSNAVITNLSSGSHNITIRDTNGCTKIFPVTISEPGGISATVTNDSLSCNGSADGIIYVRSLTGGVQPYQFSLDTIAGYQTDSTFNNLTAGNYTVTIKGNNGCKYFFATIVEEPAVLLATMIDSLDIDCFGNSTGSAEVNENGGNGTYTYAWNPSGQTTANATNLTAGNYTAIVTDQKGCQDSATVNLSQPTRLSVTINGTNLSCNNACDGQSTLTVSGGTSGYSFTWSTNAVTQNISSLCAGDYTVTVTDNNGCDTSLSITITEPDTISATTFESTQASCNNSDGGATISNIAGGTAAYQVSISGGSAYQNDTVFNGLSAGGYFIVVKDINNCTNTFPATVTEPGGITATVTNDSVKCNGNSDGIIYVRNVVGGIKPYQFSIDTLAGYQADSTFSGLGIGNYTVTIKGNNGCLYFYNTTISEPDTITAIVTSTNVTCNGVSNGCITISGVKGGVGGFECCLINCTTVDPAQWCGLSTGTYVVTVRDANGCTFTRSQTITGPPALSISSSSINGTCFAQSDGSVSATVSGGTSPYTFNWSNNISGNGAISNNVNLSFGNYCVTFTDANGCQLVQCETITEPSAIIGIAIQKTQASCGNADGVAAVRNISGGSAPHQINIDGGAYQTDSLFTGLATGTHNVTIRDANGCKKGITVEITEPNQVQAVVVQDSVNCNGGNDGSARISAWDGAKPYTYGWSDAANQTDSNAVGLTVGTYDVTVFASNGCPYKFSITVLEPDTISAETQESQAVSCNGGNDGIAEIFNADGGTPAYGYSKDNVTYQASNFLSGFGDGTFTVWVRDQNGCANDFGVTITEPDTISATVTETKQTACNQAIGEANVSNISGGTSPYTVNISGGIFQSDTVLTGLFSGGYLVTVMDANGCVNDFNVNITEPNGVTVSGINTTPVSCKGGTDGDANIFGVAGGVKPYQFSLDSVSGFQFDSAFTNLTAATYTIYLVDDNGCKYTYAFILTEPDSLKAIVITSTDINCTGDDDGTAKASAYGGTAPFSYAWGNGQTIAQATGLDANIHQVIVTDDNGCTATDAVMIIEPDPLSISVINFTDVSCNGDNDGQVVVAASGGTAPYNYAWNPNVSSSSTANNLTADNYMATVTDKNGCQDQISQTIGQPNAITISSTITNVSCSGDSDGSIDIAVSGGTTPYTYINTDNSTSPTASNLTAGSHCITVTDDNNCPASKCEVVTEPPALSATITGTISATCNGYSDGQIDLDVSGGTKPYSYDWSPATTEDLSGAPAGPYTVIVTDANGCTSTDSDSITEPDALVILRIETINTCKGFPDGSAQVFASGGTSPYGFLWSNGDAADIANNLYSGSYTISVFDINGCATTKNASVNEHPSITAIIEADPEEISILIPEIEFADSSSPNSDGVAWEWDLGDGTLTSDQHPGIHIYSDSGNYQVTLIVENQYGCKDTVTKIIRIKPELTFFVPNAFTPNGNGLNEYFNPKGFGINDFKIFIYNRWGEMIFKTEDPNTLWNGRRYNKGPMSPDGVYVWLISYTDLEGRTIRQFGHVTLLK
ncbi:PKD domain-containing protein, partial [Sphingobacteriaceae bacterium AH-315-L07]|nr:PKD domain-containing protein [Sphingobacteriaceae bacterium AH-315-L07]